MNDRLKELAEQAGLKWKAQPPHYTNTNNPIDFPVSANRDLEKFAELIVRECVEQILNGPNGYAYYAVESALRVQKHFGVEE